jgi:hypothetical protein
MTGSENNNSDIATTSSQVTESQDMSEILTTPEVSDSIIKDVPITNAPSSYNGSNDSISAQEYSDHMSLTSSQLETVALMLQVLEQASGTQYSIE